MEDFKWTDELVKEYLSQFISPLQIIGNTPIMQTKIEQFKKSKEPKKEYEIISFKHKNELYNLTNDGNYGRRNFINPASLNHVPKNAEILSVKRLYDGEVFSVDEKVYLKASDGKGVFYIRKFSIKDGQCFASSGINIMQLEKDKEVLFTTEDGVGIHEGDTYYTLEPDNNWYLYYSGAAGDGSGKRTIAKYFSTKEAGEDWLILNKPCLSLNDVVVSHDLRQLRELVKSKL